MMKKNRILISLFSIASLLLMSCAQNGTASTVSQDVRLDDEPVAFAESSASSSARDNTPACLVPVASGKTTYGNSLALIDASNTSEGYIMVNYTGSNPKVKLQITGSDGVTYTYSLHGGYETFPLSAGSGSYKAAVYENVTGNQYSTAFSQTFTAQITNTFGPYLYPNQYVNFTSDSKAISLAASLTKDAAEDLDALDAIYQYVTTHITYDSDKAATVGTGYLPDIDETLRTGTGICFDYAALTASMLRSLSIPARLDIGYSGDVRHAWVDVYIESVGWVKRAVEFNGNEWKMIDPTFAAAAGNEDNEAIDEYIGDSSNYTVQYIR